MRGERRDTYYLVDTGETRATSRIRISTAFKKHLWFLCLIIIKLMMMLMIIVGIPSTLVYINKNALVHIYFGHKTCWSKQQARPRLRLPWGSLTSLSKTKNKTEKAEKKSAADL